MSGDLPEVKFDLNLLVVDGQTRNLDDFLKGFGHWTLNVGRSETTVLQQLLVKQVVCVKQNLLATDQNDLRLRSECVVFKASD